MTTSRYIIDYVEDFVVDEDMGGVSSDDSDVRQKRKKEKTSASTKKKKRTKEATKKTVGFVDDFEDVTMPTAPEKTNKKSKTSSKKKKSSSTNKEHPSSLSKPDAPLDTMSVISLDSVYTNGESNGHHTSQRGNQRRSMNLPSQITMTPIAEEYKEQEKTKKKKKKSTATKKDADESDYDDTPNEKKKMKKKKKKSSKGKKSLYDDPEDGSRVTDGTGMSSADEDVNSLVDVEMGLLPSAHNLVESTTSIVESKPAVYIWGYRRIDLIFGGLALVWVLIMIIVISSLSSR